MTTAEAAFTPDSKLVNVVRLSPNWRARRGSERLRMVVIHGTWMRDDAAALDHLCDPAAEVSCHYYIARDGHVTQLVPEGFVAWHAGASHWHFPDGEVEGLNGFSLGIELGNAGPFAEGAPDAAGEGTVTDWRRAEPYTEAQYAALVELLKDILRRNPAILPSAVVGHDAVAPGRKSDPGAHFDWPRLFAAGVAAR